jgi:hypothetical protein
MPALPSRQRTTATCDVRRATLDVHAPELAKQWHPELNGNLQPSDVTAGSRKKVWWQCSIDPSHEWEALVGNRVRRGSGCPICLGTLRPGLATLAHSIETTHPQIAAEWHPSKNGDLLPSTVSAGSKQKAWWQCSRSNNHEWHTYVFSRVKGNGCPFCSKKRASKSYSLASQNPTLAREWDQTANGSLTPEKVTPGSGRKVWWRCQLNAEHCWQATVQNRGNGSGCPHCNRESRKSAPVESLAELVQENSRFHETFIESLEEIGTLACISIADPKMQQVQLRMLFAAVITSVETYLSDAFINTVVPDEQLRHEFMRTTPRFADKKYQLTEVLTWLDDSKRAVEKHLLDIIYHNLFIVEKMYTAVLHVDFPDQARLAALQSAIETRHHIVHRNGRTKKGERIELNVADLNALLQRTKQFIRHIDDQLKTKPWSIG